MSIRDFIFLTAAAKRAMQLSQLEHDQYPLFFFPTGLALKGGSHPDIDPSMVLERPKVMHNPRTDKFVMWMHIDSGDYELARLGVAISDNPHGPFRYQGSFRPHGQQSRDFTVFAVSLLLVQIFVMCSPLTLTGNDTALRPVSRARSAEYNRVHIICQYPAHNDLGI